MIEETIARFRRAGWLAEKDKLGIWIVRPQGQHNYKKFLLVSNPFGETKLIPCGSTQDFHYKEALKILSPDRAVVDDRASVKLPALTQENITHFMYPIPLTPHHWVNLAAIMTLIVSQEEDLRVTVFGEHGDETIFEGTKAKVLHSEYQNAFKLIREKLNAPLVKGE